MTREAEMAGAALLAAILLAAPVSGWTQTTPGYDPATNYLVLPVVTAGSTRYSEVTLRLDKFSVVAVGNSGAAAAAAPVFDSATSTLTLPAVTSAGSTFSGVVVRLEQYTVISVGIDPARLPLGDGKVSTTTAQVGYVYACTIPNSANPPGKAPWISSDGLTWDSAAKTAVQGAVSWSSVFALSLGVNFLNITGNGLPNHVTGTFPISTRDPAFAFDKNPNAILSVPIAWGLPGNPAVAARPSCTSLGAIGVLLTGSRLFNALDADGRDAAAHEVQDNCDGHPQAAGSYHYHNVSRCVGLTDAATAHSPLVGYIADGFRLYGNRGEGGKSLTNADLDECHGHTHALSVNDVSVVQYHYHATKEYPYTVGCYKGTPVTIR